MADDLADAVLKLFIGNLPFDCTPGDIDTIMDSAKIPKEEYSKFNVHMVRDRETDNFKGFAYVEVDTKEHLDAVLGLNGVEFGDRNLRIDNATGRGRGGRGGGRGGHRGGRGGGFDRNDRGFDRGQRGGHHEGGHRGGYSNEFEVVRGKRHQGHAMRGGHGGPHREPRQDDKPIVATDDAERPRLQLRPKTVDPAEVKQREAKEAEEEAARRAKIFGSN